MFNSKAKRIYTRVAQSVDSIISAHGVPRHTTHQEYASMLTSFLYYLVWDYLEDKKTPSKLITLYVRNTAKTGEEASILREQFNAIMNGYLQETRDIRAFGAESNDAILEAHAYYWAQFLCSPDENQLVEPDDAVALSFYNWIMSFINSYP